VCTHDKTSLNKKQCPPYAYSTLHSTFPPTVIFTTSSNNILSRFGVSVTHTFCTWLSSKQSARTRFLETMQYLPLTNHKKVK